LKLVEVVASTEHMRLLIDDPLGVQMVVVGVTLQISVSWRFDILRVNAVAPEVRCGRRRLRRDVLVQDHDIVGKRAQRTEKRRLRAIVRSGPDDWSSTIADRDTDRARRYQLLPKSRQCPAGGTLARAGFVRQDYRHWCRGQLPLVRWL
jgi:hypothetical protein